MFEGLLSGQTGSIRWLYDCGSNQRRSLRREIRQVATSASIDFLFVSHLDSDHINGINRLLAKVHVSEVVLPYLKELDLALLISRDSANGRLSRRFTDFAMDPSGWFFDRNVSRVSFIKGKSDDGSSEGGFDLPVGPPDDSARTLTYKWSHSPTKVSQGGRVQYFDTKAIVQITSGPQVIWVLVPYAHRPPARGVHRFLRRMRARFGRRISIPAIVDALRTPAGRTNLRFCYDAIWVNHNFVSMSLFSGTLTRPRRTTILPRSIRTASTEIGWISTGDSNMAVTKRREAFLNYYRRVHGHVGFLVLPHHGALDSFHPDLLRRFPNLSVGIAAAGPNGYGHPHAYVRQAVRSVCQFHQVTEAPPSRLGVHASI